MLSVLGSKSKNPALLTAWSLQCFALAALQARLSTCKANDQPGEDKQCPAALGVTGGHL